MTEKDLPRRGDEAAELERRLQRLRGAMTASGLDVLVAGDSGAWFTPSGNTRYLTGFSLGPMPGVVTGTAVVVSRTAPAVLVVPQGPLGCFAAWARSHPLVQDVESDPNGGLAGHLLEDVVAAVRRTAGPRARVGVAGGFDRSAGLADLLPDADVVNTAVADGAGVRRDLLERLRATKSPWEIELLQGAQRCAEAGMDAYFAAVAPGRRLAQAAAEADAAAVRAGADEQLTIMSCGVDPWMWWHAQGERRFEVGRVVTLETNARYRGYVAQFARAFTETLPMPGAEIVAARAHNWVTDPFTLGGTSLLRPGQMSRLEAIRAPEGRLTFATADISSAMPGYDGAIQTGIRAAREAAARAYDGRRGTSAAPAAAKPLAQRNHRPGRSS